MATGLTPEQKHQRRQQDLLARAIEKAEEVKLKRRGELTRLMTDLARSREDAKAEEIQLAAAQREEGGGGFSMAAAKPSSISGAEGVAAESRTSLGDFLKETETKSKETSTPGPTAEGGLPPRTLDVTTTSQQQLGLGRANILRLIPGLENLGTRETSSTRTAPNPEFEEAVSRRAASIGDAAFRLANGDMRPDRFAPFAEAQLRGFTPAERQQVMVRSQQTSVALMGLQQAKNRAAGNAIGLELLERYPSGGGKLMQAAHRQVNARTPEEIREAAENYVKTVYNTKEAKAGRDRQATDDHIRKVNSQIADLNLEQAQYEASLQGPIRDRNIARIKTLGFLEANGLAGNRKEQQVTQSINSYKNADGGIAFTEQARGLIEQDQLDALRLGMQVPLASEGGIIEDPAFRNFDFRLFEKYTHALDGRGFGSHGLLVQDEEAVDPKQTNQIRRQAISYIRGLGLKVDENGQLQVPEDNVNKTVLNRALELIVYRDAYEAQTGRTVPSIFDFQREFAGGAKYSPPEPEERPAAPPTTGGTLGASFREFNRGVIERSRQVGGIAGTRREAAARGREQAGTFAQHIMDFFREANK